MTSKSVSFSMLALALLFAAGTTNAQSNQKQGRASLLHYPVDENTAIRLFYQPQGDYFHAPLVIRVVNGDKAMLITAPMLQEGRTTYVSLAEMRELAQKLAKTDLEWQESETAVALGSYKKLVGAGIGVDAMEILVVGSNETARAKVPPKAICKTLKPLDASLRTPRALWEFQRFQVNYGCKVPGFKPNAYPDHY